MKSFQLVSWKKSVNFNEFPYMLLCSSCISWFYMGFCRHCWINELLFGSWMYFRIKVHFYLDNWIKSERRPKHNRHLIYLAMSAISMLNGKMHEPQPSTLDIKFHLMWNIWRHAKSVSRKSKRSCSRSDTPLSAAIRNTWKKERLGAKSGSRSTNSWSIS